MARIQIQWRTRPDGEWKYHSMVEQSAAAETVAHYTNKHGEHRLFDYRIVPTDSQDALPRTPDPVFVPTGEPTFQFNRSNHQTQTKD